MPDIGSGRGGASGPSIDAVSALRAGLWDAGFRPVPVYNHDRKDDPGAGKRPLGERWAISARKNPPLCATSPAVPHALNTGILTDHMRAIDIDVDDPRPFVKDTAERLGAATSSAALCATTTCSAAISEDWCIQPKRHDWDWTDQARLWGALVGDPSILKTPIIRLTTAPLTKLDRDARKVWGAAMADYMAKLAAWKAVKKNPEPQPTPPRKSRYVVESITIEALQEVLRDDVEGKMTAPLGKVLCRQDELSSFLAGMDRYSTGGKGGTAEQAAWLGTYNGGDYTVDRIGRGSFTAASWSVCVIGGIQPEVIQKIAADAAHDGLLQRFQYDVPAASGAGLDCAPDRAARELYHAIIPALAELRPALNDHGFPRHVMLNDAAHATREDIERLARTLAAMPDTSPQLQSVFGKWPGTFARLCLTYHLIEVASAPLRGFVPPDPYVVSAATANCVRDYMRAVLAPMQIRADALMFSTRMDRHAAWIAGYILARKLDRVVISNILAAYRPLRGPDHRSTLDGVMDSLDRIGWLAAETTARSTNAPTAWRVNPKVHTRFAERAEAERKRRAEARDAIARDAASRRGTRAKA